MEDTKKPSFSVSGLVCFTEKVKCEHILSKLSRKAEGKEMQIKMRKEGKEH